MDFLQNPQQPMQPAAEPTQMPVKQAVDEETCRKWTLTLNKYRAGKANLEGRVIEAERWWKLRNQQMVESRTDKKNQGYKGHSAWLHNVIVSKHADAIEAYPQPNILPREEDDKVEAWSLSQIVPCIMEHNHFESVYDAVQWQKLKTGTGVYKVFWDSDKLNGMGDISITRVDLLNLFWQPGIEDIQDSKYVFHTETVEKEDLIEQYPQLDGEKLGSTVTPRKFPTDDYVSDEDAVVVVDVYYKRRGVLHYAKFVGEQIIYATENDPEKAQSGLYGHGLYPYVFDVLYPVEGSPAGYGYIDTCRDPQTRIDLINDAVLKNTLAAATPRFFCRADGNVNDEEFLNLEQTLVHVNGNLAEDSIRAINAPQLGAYYTNYLAQTVQELRETTGNTESSNGVSTSGATAASAIAALQEAAGKGSRAANLAAYRAYSEVVNLVIELIRQFYDLPRQFRITGKMGEQKFMEFSNAGMQPQWQGMIGGMDMGFRLPVYDIKIEPQKKTRYQQVTQNELAKELFGLGLFQPEAVNQALLVLDMMDFDGKAELQQKLAQQGTVYQTLIMWQQLGLSLAMQYRPDMVPQLAAQITGQPAQQQGAPAMNANGNVSRYSDKNGDGNGEHPIVEKARAQSQEASQPR